MQEPPDPEKIQKIEALKEKVSLRLREELNRILTDEKSRQEPLPADLKIESPEDALWVCFSLKAAMLKVPEAVRPLARILRRSKSTKAYAVFWKYGMPLVQQQVRELSTLPLKVGFNPKLFEGLAHLAGFIHEPSFPLIHSLSRTLPVAENYGWHRVFGSIRPQAPRNAPLIELLTTELPEAHASGCFMEWGNEHCHKGHLKSHPFDTRQGMERLESYLTCEDPERYAYAVSAAFALAFLCEPAALIKLASAHPYPDVRIEAAWAKAKRGDEESLEVLAEFCLDWRTALRAARDLRELGREDRIPVEARIERSQAMAVMADWLKHPNELNKLPEELDIIDHREILWPPKGERALVTLLRWKCDGRTGVGLTGPDTWCFFSDADKDLPVLDIYAKHCNAGLKEQGHPDAPEDYTNLEHGRILLRSANPMEDWTATG